MVRSEFDHALWSRNSRFGHSSNSTMMAPRKSENSGRSSWPKPGTTGRSRRFVLTRLHPFCGRPRPSWIRAAYIIQIKSATSLTGLMPTASENLIVSDTWAIYARQRSNNVLLGDLDRLKAAVDEAKELPRASTRLVTEPSNETPEPDARDRHWRSRY